jgi:sec-independent protein translocase protein TatB
LAVRLETPVFDLSLTKIAVLLVIAVVIFGPDQLPKVAAQAGRALRELRRLADGARRDLAEGLGPEFGDFDIADLNPRTFVRKHLLDEFEADPVVTEPEAPYAGEMPHPAAVLAPGESPPYDAEAT